MSDGFVFASEEEAQAACLWWQGELRLTDWRIKVVTIPIWESTNPTNGDASIKSNDWNRYAVLELLDPQHREPASIHSLPQDQEEDIVHELIHLKMLGWKADATDLEKESGAIDLSTALVRLRRQAYPEEPWRKDQA